MAKTLNIDTKQHIIDSACQLIKKRKLEDISLKNIADEAKISKGTLYYYYTSKDLIILDIVSKYLKDLEDAFISWVENREKVTTLERLINYVLSYGSKDYDRAILHFYLLNQAINSGDTIIKDKFKETYNKWKELLKINISERVKVEGIDSETLATILLTIIDGIIIQNFIGTDKIDCMKIANLLSK
jgi:AcrR family transcriptional regulator